MAPGRTDGKVKIGSGGMSEKHWLTLTDKNRLRIQASMQQQCLGNMVLCLLEGMVGLSTKGGLLEAKRSADD